MLHISDIEKRLKISPEPPEVRDMRECITESFKNLEFFEVPHKYTLHKPNGEDIELPSVSSIVSKFEPEADWDTILTNKAKKLGMPREELGRQWEETNLTSTSNGTIVHEFGESSMYFFQGRFDEMLPYTKQRQFEKGYLVPFGPKQEAVTKFYTDMLDKYDVWPVMPEAKVYTGLNDKVVTKLQYCGTFDMLFAARGKDGVIRPFLADWKTNKSLQSEYNRAYNKVMLPPFDNMIDENLSHYTLQLSLYAIPLLQLGYKMTHRIIVWLKQDGTYEKIPVPDITDILIKTI